MASVTATDFKNVMNLSDTELSATNAEYILDLAIDTLNLYGADLTNMAGDAGTKTVTLDTKQRAAVFIAGRAIYYGFFRDIATHTISGLSLTATDLMSNPQVLEVIREAAKRLEAKTDIPFTVAEAES